jgi:hypothetical protein
VGLPDIETDVPDERIVRAMDLCAGFSEGGRTEVNA